MILLGLLCIGLLAWALLAWIANNVLTFILRARRKKRAGRYSNTWFKLP
jgi:hypothetical protein